MDGSIFDSTGAPLNGVTASITVNAYNAASGGTLLWGPAAYSPPVSAGRFTIDLDASTGAPSLTQALANAVASQSIWFELSYGGTIVRPRIRARGTLFAVNAATADSLRTVTISTSTPTNNYVLTYSSAATSWGPTSVTSMITGAYVYRAGDTMTGNLSLPLLSAATVNVTSLAATHLVRTDAAMNLISVTANVADSDLANIAGTTGNLQAQINSKLLISGTNAGTFSSLSPALTVTGGTASVFGSGVQIAITTANATSLGLVSPSDWTNFNSRVSTGAQNANTVLAGPTGGVAALPTFRALVPQDLGSGTPTSGTFLRGDGTWAALPGVPAGSIEAWGGTTLPAGWLWCDGSSYLQATYPDLFNAIGTAYGTADATHFNVPDLRGFFIRGTDNYGAGASGYDPDTSTRTALNAGGNTGNAVGSFEADQFLSHVHTIYEAAYTGYYVKAGASGYTWNDTGGYTGAAGGNETRPKNIYVNYIIKYVAGAPSGTILSSDLATYVSLASGSISGTLSAVSATVTSLSPNSAILTTASSQLTSLPAGVSSTVMTSNGSAWAAATPMYFGANCGAGFALQGFDVNGNKICTAAPTTSSASPTFQKIVGGYYAMCGLLSDNTVMCWGNNGYGELGNGNTATATVPGFVRNFDGSKFSGAVDIAMNYDSTCAARSDGTAWCWGYNPYYGLGDGTTTSRYNPVQVVGVTGAVKIAVSDYTACALLSSGGVNCWGYNGNGELGNGANTTSPTATQVVGVTSAISISGGSSHYCIVKTGNTAACWGYNGYGQLGNNSTTSSNVPVAVSGLTNVIQISAGGDYNSEDHSCVVKSDGTVWCWGLGTNGQLGNGAVANSNVPVQVTGITTAVNVSAGGLMTAIVKSDGSVWAFGYNDYGGVGDGTTTERNTPVQVLGVGGVGALSGISQVAIIPDWSGSWGEAAAALTSAGRVLTWGYNGYGELGNNTETTVHTAVGAWYP